LHALPLSHSDFLRLGGQPMSNSAQNPANPAPSLPTTPSRTEEKETVLWRGSFSSKAMFGTWLGNIAITIIVLVASFLVPLLGPLTWLFGLGFIALLWIVTAGIYLYRRLAIQYEITTQRLIHQRGILLRVTDRIELIDVDDISFSQGIVQRMLGVGNITVTGSDKTDPVLVMIGIDQVDKVSGMLDDARRSERRKHSVHIEAV
jgi:membrane protein YdbS with pleckstrin-like domain